MVELQILRQDEEGRVFELVQLEDFVTLPRDLGIGSPHFVMLVVADAQDAGIEEISSFLESALDLGCIGISTWGADCERVHDIFDEIVVHRELETGEDDTRPSSWHSGESLEDALWYWMNVAGPNDAFVESCSDWLCVLVGEPVDDAIVRKYLENPALLERN